MSNVFFSFSIALVTIFFPVDMVSARNLEEIRSHGVLRHLGVPYASFVNYSPEGQLDGLDVDLMKRFAHHLGVSYEWVETSWKTVINDLVGQSVTPTVDGRVLIDGTVKVRGDIIANGLTILPWRAKVVDYSTPTFPTGVWLIARVDSPLKPISPSGELQTDIQGVKSMLADRSVLSMKGTCIEPRLYDLAATGADIRYHTATEKLDDIAQSIIDGAAEATLLDIPNALVALQKWPGEIKVIGPLSEPQFMGVATPKTSPNLLKEFNTFFEALKLSGEYDDLVRKYYPSVYLYREVFFTAKQGE